MTKSIIHKVCRTCLEPKPTTDFVLNIRKADGRDIYCSKCRQTRYMRYRTVKPFTPPPSLDGEEWRAIPSYEGIYSVSNFGRIRRDLGGYANAKAGRILKAAINFHGYYDVRLCKEGRARVYTVHSLVAAAFIGARPQGLFINHLDGIKTNNIPENLEYCTREQNMRHASEHGLMSCGEKHGALTKPNTPRGERNNKAKLNEAQVKEIRAKYAAGGITTYQLAAEYHVSRPNICEIVNRTIWTHI